MTQPLYSLHIDKCASYSLIHHGAMSLKKSQSSRSLSVICWHLWLQSTK